MLSDTATLTITALNDAPTSVGNLTLTSIPEDTSNPSGAAINTLTGLGFQDVDTGATLSGILVVANTANGTTEGVWQYSTDGTNWEDIGTVADNATALALSATTQVRFVPVANYNGTPAALTIRALDNTYSGSFSTTTGGTETRVTADSSANGGTTAISASTNTLGTTVTPINDQPTISGDKTISDGVNEGSPIVISNSGTAGLVIVDDIEASRNEGSGANQGQVSVTITVPNGLSHGSVTLGSTTGISITAGADNSNTVTIKGSLTDVNNALDGLSFTPGDDTNVSETVTITVNDLGNNGTGSTTALTATQTITISNIIPSNNAPVVTAPATVTATEDTTFTFSGANAISLSDVDVRSTDIIKLTLNLSSAGTFRFSSATGLFTDTAGTIPYTLTNETAGADVIVYGTLANLNAALNGMTYAPASNLNSVNVGSDYIGGVFSGHVHLDITVDDLGYGEGGAQGLPLTDTTTVDITVNPVNDAPSIVGPTSNSSYIEQASPVTIGAGVTVTDSIDDTNMSGATVTISANFRTGDTLAADTTGTSITATYNPTTHILTLSGADTTANYNQVLQSVTFSNSTNDAPTSGGATTRTITWQATDANADSASNGVQNSNSVTSSITITPVSDAPAGTDTTVTVNEDAVYTFTTANFGFSDPLDSPTDSFNRVLITTLPANGLLKLNGVDITVAGTTYVTVAEINSGLLTYTPPADANGTAYTSFTFQVEDTGTTINGGVILDQSANTMTIDVTKLNDAPVLSGHVDINPIFGPQIFTSENSATGSGLSVDPTQLFQSGDLTFSDIDLSTTTGLNSTTFGAGSISIVLLNGVTGDVLQVASGTLPAGVTTSGGTGSNPLVITLDNDTTLTEIETILQNIEYLNTSDNPTSNNTHNTRIYNISLDDSDNSQSGGNAGGPTSLSSITVQGVIIITSANDAPVVDLNGASAGQNNLVTWTEGANSTHTAVNISSSGTLTDADNTNLTQMVLTVGGLRDGNNEVLTIGGQAFSLATTYSNVDVGNFLVSYDNTTGVFTIVPDGANVQTLSNFQTLLQGTTYNNLTDNPTAGNRFVSVQVTDAGTNNLGDTSASFLSSNIPTTAITVVRANDQPTVTGLDAVTYFENAINATAALIDSDVTLTDIDSADYNGGTLTVSGLVSGQDTVSLPTGAANVLGNVQRNGSDVEYFNGSSWVIIGTHSGGSGSNFVVTFNANATPAIVERVIENLTFANSSDNPTLTRTLTLAVNDGDGGSVQNATVAVTIRLDNDAPVMSATSLGANYTEQGSAIAFVGGTISVSDPDSPSNFFTGGVGSLRVSLDSYVFGDTLSIANQGNSAGQIGVSGSTIRFGGTAFATFSGGSASDLVITFNSATATPAAVQALLDRLRYNCTSNDPTVNATDPSRVFTITLNDGGNTKDATSSTTALTATLTGTINITAVNDAPTITVPFTLGAYTENNAATIVDAGLTVSDTDDTHITGGTVSFDLNFLNGDILAVTDTVNISSSYNSSSGILTLTGLATVAEYQTVLRTLTYQNTTDDPTDNVSKLTRLLAVNLTDANSDGVGAATGGVFKAIVVTPLTDAPVLGGENTPRTYIEDDASGVTLEPNMTLTDADDTNMVSATVTISSGYTTGDVLTFTTIPAINASYSAGVLTLTGSGTVAEYLQVLHSVKFLNTTNDPTVTSATRTVSWTTVDADSDATGAATSNTVTTQINITPQNDNPTAVDDSNSITEDTAPNPVTGDVTPGSIGQDSDPDSHDVLVISAIRTGTEASGTGTSGTIGAALAGSYGNLTIADDGSYSYELDNNNPDVNALKTGQSLTEVFTYTLDDQNGGTDQAQLVITIHGTTDGSPSLLINDNNAAATGEVTVYEAGLTSVVDTSETNTGTITISAPDGLDSIAILGTSLSLTDLANLSTTPIDITASSGILTLTGYTSTSNVGGVTTGGELTYSYTLNILQNTPAATESFDSLDVEVFDASAGVDSGFLTVQIIDDTPTANDDANSVTEGTTSGPTTTSGNVYTGLSAGDVADDQGADTNATPITGVSFGATTGTIGSAFAGNYGELTLNADGSYDYALHNDNSTVNQLLVGETLTEEFTYTLTDDDGDSTTAVLTIIINGVTDGAPTIDADDSNGAATGDNTVYEHGLTSVVDTTETTTGTISVSAAEGIDYIEIEGTLVTLGDLNNLGTTPITITTSKGELTLTAYTSSGEIDGISTGGSIAYSYTLTSVQNTPGASENTDVIALSITDRAEESSNGNFTIQIIDDTPVANNDSNSITEDGSATTSGNVYVSGSAGDVTDEQGADTNGTPITAISFGATNGTLNSALAGNYGSLTLSETGAYTYTIDNSNADVNALKTGDSLSEVYTYTLTDADGDSTTATLTITINGATDGAPSIFADDGNGAATGDNTVYEVGLTSVGDTSETTTGTISIAAAEGIDSVTLG
ncbi:hypothetical protein VZ94_14500, partial [Methylocucumis oryzae]